MTTSNSIRDGSWPSIAISRVRRSAPRIHGQWAPPTLTTEGDLDPATAADLTARGHTLRRLPFAGAVQVVAARDGSLIAAADQRKSGGAAAR